MHRFARLCRRLLALTVTLSVKATVLVTLPLAPPALAADWPQWRGGPARDGTWHEPGLPASLPKDGPRELWHYSLGTGYSGPAVAGSQVVIMDRQKSKNGQPETERVLCLDAHTGKELWIQAYPSRLKFSGGYENGPRATPTVEGDRVYTLGAMGQLYCLELASGRVVWNHDLVQTHQARVPWWGVANAPLIENKAVIVQVGGLPEAGLVAFDKTTGKELWHSLTNRAGYSSLLAITSAKQRQIIAWTADGICSLNPDNGQLFWQHPRRLRWDQAVATPLFHPGLNLLLFPSDREGTLALQLDADKPASRVAWDNFSFSALHSNPILEGTHLYGINHNGDFKEECGEFRCLDLVTGRKVWAVTNVARLAMHTQASLTRNSANGLFYITNEGGELILAEATPDHYRQVARAQVSGKTWSHPAYAHGRLYTRTETTLACFELKEGDR